MNKLFLIVCSSHAFRWACILFNHPCSSVAQTPWSSQPSGVTQHLTGAQILDHTHGWAVGWGGKIIKWNGSTWSQQTSGVPQNIQAVWFNDASNGWAVGGGGKILHTTDGGVTWLVQTWPNFGWSFNSIQFADPSTGWIAGDDGIILNTVDGGATWSLQSSPVNYGLSDVVPLGPHTAYIVGPAGTIMKTTNAGVDWGLQVSNTNAHLYAACFLDEDHGWAVGASGTITRTVDGGVTWTSQTSNTSLSLQAVHFLDGNHGYVTGSQGLLLRTSDGGITWAQEATGASNQLFAISFVDPYAGWIVGTSGTILRYAGVKLSVKAYLEGPFDVDQSRMRDDLRTSGLLPLTEPYTGLGHALLGSSAGILPTQVLATSGDNAIVDWVVIEVRSPMPPYSVVRSETALLQRDGDVVGMDGVSPLFFAIVSGDYHVAARHRNHLGCMTATPIPLSSIPASVDFTSPGTLCFGTEGRKAIGDVSVLWAGNTDGNGVLKYIGQDNDRDPILAAIGGVVPTNTVTAYLSTDVNMDGIVKYTGNNNDRDLILVNIGGSVPTGVRVEQVP